MNTQKTDLPATIPAFQLDELGYYVGDTVADLSPLEDGVYHVPYLCVLAAPPPAVDGALRRYVGDEWRLEEIPQSEPAPQPAPEPDPAPVPAEPEPEPEPEPELAPVAPTLDEAKAQALTAINGRCELELRVIKTGYPEAEVQSWPKQEAEARAYAADDTAATPLLSAMSAARGVELTVLAAKVIEKADLFALASGWAIGSRQACEDAIAAAQTPEEALAVTWPEPVIPEAPEAPEEAPAEPTAPDVPEEAPQAPEPSEAPGVPEAPAEASDEPEVPSAPEQTPAEPAGQEAPAADGEVPQ